MTEEPICSICGRERKPRHRYCERCAENRQIERGRGYRCISCGKFYGSNRGIPEIRICSACRKEGIIQELRGHGEIVAASAEKKREKGNVDVRDFTLAEINHIAREHNTSYGKVHVWIQEHGRVPGKDEEI